MNGYQHATSCLCGRLDVLNGLIDASTNLCYDSADLAAQGGICYPIAVFDTCAKNDLQSHMIITTYVPVGSSDATFSPPRDLRLLCPLMWKEPQSMSPGLAGLSSHLTVIATASSRSRATWWRGVFRSFGTLATHVLPILRLWQCTRPPLDTACADRCSMPNAAGVGD